MKPLSASQVQLYKDCKRKWAYRYLEGIKAPQHPSAELGSRVHEVLEAWSRDGTAPKLDEVYVTQDGRKHRPGRIAAAGLPFLPRPGQGDTEKRIEVHWAWAYFRGYIDLLDDYRIFDHKTTSDFRWMKTEDELRQDIQSAIYAAHVLSKWGHAELRWTYIRTRGMPAAQQIKIQYTNQDLDNALKVIKPLSLEIYDHYKNKPEVQSLEPNLNQCDAYGGCPYRDRCALTPRERLKGLMAQESLRDKMKARLAAQKAAKETVPVVSVETTGAPKVSLKEKLAARKTKGVNPPEAPLPDPPPPNTVVQPPTVEQVMSDNSLVKGYTLYVDCYPISNGVRPTNASEILAAGATAVANELKLPHYRMADYAKGPAALSVWLDERLAEQYQYADVFIDSRTAEARDTLTIFEKYAATIVRGL